MKNIYVLMYSLIFLVTYFLLDIINFKKKSQNIIKNLDIKNRFAITSNYFNSISELLKRLNFPYKLNLKKYIFIKYIFSVVIFFISLLNYKSPAVPTLLGICTFFIPNILIRSYEKNQNIKLIKELKNINTNLILKLSAYVPLKDAIKSIPASIEDNGLKEKFMQFAYEYEIMNFNIKKPAENIMLKFKSPELISFMSMLMQSIDNGNIIENLERFNATLELSYHKYLNSKATKRMTYVILGTVIILINIIVISMYPIVIQVLNNLNLIFS